MRDLPVFGWKEQVALPEWGIRRLRAKLDTGAKRCALHVVDLREIGEHERRGETLPVVEFGIHVGSRDDPRTKLVQAPVVRFRTVRDTSARAEERPVVRTRILCGPLDLITDITLTSREGMNFRMLIGRVAMEDRLVVDPGRGYLVSPRPPRRKGSHR